MFVDEVKIYAKAGHGGKGAVAFHREAYVAKGGPDGGNGGCGGDVILEASHDLNNLIEQFFNSRLVAPDGDYGMGKGMDGKAGKDLIIKVPCGTLVWRVRDTTPALEPGSRKKSEMPVPPEEPEAAIVVPAGRRPMIRAAGHARALEVSVDEPDATVDAVDASKRELVCDLTKHQERFILCHGGRGGLGNRNFATSRNQTPRYAQPGEPGTEGDYLLELRIIADVGILGYPNAGKSTLLTAISHARPKVAAYPFTTLHPQIGILEYPDFARLTVCDVPGLIEGAHKNVGLGHEFLRHLRRCKVLVVLLDMAGTDGRTPWDDHAHLLKELELYDPAFLDRPRIVVANKVDEPAALENLKTFKKKVKKTPVLSISAAFGEGLPLFRETIRTAVEATGTLLHR